MRPRFLAVLVLALIACDQDTIGPSLPTVKANWRVIRPASFQPELTSVIAFATNDIYASHSGFECNGDVCGVSESQFFHYDGTRWRELKLPPGAGWVYDLWGRSSDDLYAIGRGGSVYHFDGASWTPEPVSGYRITGNSTAVFTSFAETIFERTPSGWDTLRTFDDYVDKISAAEDGALLALTDLGATLWNGVEWKNVLQIAYRLHDAVCLSMTDAFILQRSVGGWDVLRWNGDEISTVYTIPDRSLYEAAELSFVGDNPNQLFIVGDGGTAHRFNGAAWLQIERGTAVDLVAGSVPDTGELVAVGGLGKVLSFDGANWRTLREAAPRYIQDFWAESPSRLIISDYRSTFVLDGASFSETSPPPTGVYRMSGYSIEDVYATSGNEILHFDGIGWSVDDSLATYLYDITAATNGTVYAAGPNAAYRRAGSWERIYDGPIEFGHIVGGSTRAVAAGGYRDATTGIVGVFDGATWRMRPIPDYPVDVILTSHSEILVAGYAGVYRSDGDDFVAVPSLAAMRPVYRIFELAPERFVAFAGERYAYYDGVFWLIESDESRFRQEQAHSGDVLGVGYAGSIAKWELVP